MILTSHRKRSAKPEDVRPWWKLKPSSPWIPALSLAIGIVVILTALALGPPERLRDDCVRPGEPLAYKWRTYLSIILVATNRTVRLLIPANIGIEKYCTHALSTVAEDGMIHVQSKEVGHIYILSDFLRIWGVLDRMWLPQQMIVGPEQVTPDFAVQLLDGRPIQLTYSYTWPFENA